MFRLKFIINDNEFKYLRLNDLFSNILKSLNYFNIFSDINGINIYMNCILLNLKEFGEYNVIHHYFDQLYLGFNKIIYKPFIYKGITTLNLSPIKFDNLNKIIEEDSNLIDRNYNVCQFYTELKECFFDNFQTKMNTNEANNNIISYFKIKTLFNGINVFFPK